MLAGLVLARDHSGRSSMDIFGDIGVSEKLCLVQSVSSIGSVTLWREFLLAPVGTMFAFCWNVASANFEITRKN